MPRGIEEDASGQKGGVPGSAGQMLMLWGIAEGRSVVYGVRVPR
jgi:hypothetical protein